MCVLLLTLNRMPVVNIGVPTGKKYLWQDKRTAREKIQLPMENFLFPGYQKRAEENVQRVLFISWFFDSSNPKLEDKLSCVLKHYLLY